ncbi:hypothetical protein J8L98_12150 [Pseudoalteromonas sp. MMG013]|uniref:Uncharacterized protein n=1 Tax=Pseudoalteromonas aurantia 208 TaxID=1314867 RepID=A0ABR9EBG4_9GAMM|nr:MULTISPECIES: hypothetical protein [Pseudoalteromonas]MBE0368304.1 hypothetical protein [Pseudoalteromonas aurantia 208]MBQ4847876.1 hypothetical protein [Pseudoalteromonas sp. MMG005]MBQ4849792.1 hypothetical protein [Pseudoalteromonas sp. MMG012]MBQ4862440.1 hypothetical protein [Pseudoalteromonas sp. MMG013]
MKKLIAALIAATTLTVSAQSDEINTQLLSQKIKIVAIGQSGFDPRWREPTCSITKTDKDEFGQSYMISHFDMCTCQNSLKASYLIEDTQDNPDQKAVICYIPNN